MSVYAYVSVPSSNSRSFSAIYDYYIKQMWWKTVRAPYVVSPSACLRRNHGEKFSICSKNHSGI